MNENAVSPEELKKFSEEFNSNEKNIVAANSSVRNGLEAAAEDYRSERALQSEFNVSLKQGPVTDQKSSGRCWLFSALNTMRYEFINKYGLESFELSQNYLFFYDKLEKANYFLESAIKTAGEPLDGRLYSFISMNPLGDGGQWSMFSNLVEKYGVVPKSAYPDSANAEKSRSFVHYITSKLREDAAELRKLVNAGESMEKIRDRKARQLSEIYRCLVIALGEPPASFDFIVRTKDGKVMEDRGITPKEFYRKYFGYDFDDFVSVINAPSDDKPFDRMYTVKFLGNVVEGRPVSYLNLRMDVIKKAVIAQLKDGHPVWFGSDCVQFLNREKGIFDRQASGIENLLGIKLGFTKGERLMYGDSAMNHAMVIQGVNLGADGKPDRWRIENSWGEDSGNKGYFTASDSWFDEFVYQIVVGKKYLDDSVLRLLDQKMIELEPWDPMGTLAD
ncbi:MAG: C1 family peptidase [Oscillospiraceae bacterium]|jgi:bleomycin hydrolase